MFLSEFCEALDLPRPDPASDDTRTHDYVFERGVKRRESEGMASTLRIDLYKRGAFILEAKQSRAAQRIGGGEDGQRKHCELAVTERGAAAGGLSRKTEILVIGAYATESWKHSSFGNKILQACDWRDEGRPISIVSEEHWNSHL